MNVFFDILPLILLITLNKINIELSFGVLLLIIIFLLLSVLIKYRISLSLNNNIQLFRHKYSFSTLSSLVSIFSFSEKELDNSARKVLSESDFTVNSFARPLERLISSSLLILLIISVLLYQNFFITISLFFIIVFPYLILFFIFRVKIKYLGEKRAVFNKNRFQSCLTLLNVWKEAKIFNFEKTVINDFEENSKNFCKTISLNYTLNSFPKYLFEVVILIIFITINLNDFLYSSIINNFKTEEIPLFAFSAFKVIPSINSLFASLGMLKFGSSIPKVDNYSLLSHTNPNKKFKLLFIKKLNYKLGNKIYNIENLTFKGNILIHGRSGCGKSTFIDVMCGFKKSINYDVRCDNEQIQSNLFLQQCGVAFQVPKLINSNIINNIILNSKFDDQKFKDIVNLCHLSELSLETNIENINHSLSGGQLQRISLARALYSESSILFLDEPTNGLPEKMSLQIIDSIRNYYKGILVIITHDPALLKMDFQKFNFDEI